LPTSVLLSFSPRPDRVFKNYTGEVDVICDADLSVASLQHGFVKFYDDMDSWRVDDGLAGVMTLVRATTLVPESVNGSYKLCDVVDKILIVHVDYMDKVCERIGSIPRETNMRLQCVGVYNT